MSVFFLPSRQKWAVNYLVKGKYKRKQFNTQKEAETFLAEHKQGTQEEPERPTLGEIVIKFFQAHESYHRETKKKIIYLLAGYEKNGKHIEGVGEFLRDKYADTLNRRDLDQLREGLKKRKASNSTCNKYQAYIRAILAWAVDQEYIVLNPWRDFKRLPVKQRIHTATIEHFKKIIAHAPPWLQWAFYTAYACSLRFGQVELFSLTWEAFQWQQGCVTLYQGKSGRLKRVYPSQEYMQVAHARYLEDMGNGIPLVCHRNGRKVLSYKTVWTSTLKKAGMEGMNIRPYDIRHVSATEMLSRGVDPATVASQLGHSTPATTMNFYAHTSVANQKRAGESLPSLSSDGLVTKNDHENKKEKG